MNSSAVGGLDSEASEPGRQGGGVVVGHGLGVQAELAVAAVAKGEELAGGGDHSLRRINKQLIVKILIFTNEVLRAAILEPCSFFTSTKMLSRLDFQTTYHLH